MARMKTWKVTVERHNPQFDHSYITYREVEAATAQSAINKIQNRLDKHTVYGCCYAIDAELA